MKNILKSAPVSRKTLLAYLGVLAVVMLVIDYILGPFVQFPFLFILPVIISSWYCGTRWGLFYSVLLPLIRFWFSTIWVVPWTIFESSVNAAIRMGVLAVLAILTNRVAQQTRMLEKEVKTLEGLLPICSSCKKIRISDNEWMPIENYISEHSQAVFSHGICPDCMQRLYPDYA